MVDRGLTHVALETIDSDRSVAFYARYAGMEVVHRRGDEHGTQVVWLSDRTRPFVIVLIRLCAEAASEGVLVSGPEDSGDADGH